MNTFKYLALVAVSIGSLCSLEAMDPTSPRSAHPEPVEGRRDSSHAISPRLSLGVAGAPKEQRRMDQVEQAVDGVLKQIVVTQGDIVKLIRDGHAKAEYQPEEALGLFQQAYEKAGSRMWELGLKDGKLVWVVCYDGESDQKDPQDIKLWKLLLDKVELFRDHTEGAMQEKVELLCMYTSRKLTAAHGLKLSLAEDVDKAWQAETLEKIHDRTPAERLANAREAVKPDFQDSLIRGLGFRPANLDECLGCRPVDLDECNEFAKRELRELEGKRLKVIYKIITERERTLAQLQQAAAQQDAQRDQ